MEYISIRFAFLLKQSNLLFIGIGSDVEIYLDRSLSPENPILT